MTMLEHVNMRVSDVDEAIRFFQTAFPDFQIRGGRKDSESQWVHIGIDGTYLCLNGPVKPLAQSSPLPHGFVNHFGFIVEDADAVRERLLAAGFREGFKVDPHPYRKRVYILDGDNNEYEFVQYLTDDPAKRYVYD
jgi:catechol 2,3-dioxygenase-like lactoylglutathione lyase family enzyme